MLWYNYYAHFDPHNFHSYKEIDFNARVDAAVGVKLRQSQWSVKYMIYVKDTGHTNSACLKGML